MDAITKNLYEQLMTAYESKSGIVCQSDFVEDAKRIYNQIKQVSEEDIEEINPSKYPYKTFTICEKWLLKRGAPLAVYDSGGMASFPNGEPDWKWIRGLYR